MRRGDRVREMGFPALPMDCRAAPVVRLSCVESPVCKHVEKSQRQITKSFPPPLKQLKIIGLGDLKFQRHMATERSCTPQPQQAQAPTKLSLAKRFWGA